ncbi:MAG: YtxH domain-containing protein [Candidatus Xenobia bacterium]
MPETPKSRCPISPPAFMAGFAVGVLAGAATSILLTPQSGQKTRNLLGNSMSENLYAARQQWLEMADEMREDLGEWTQRTRERMGGALKRGNHEG